MADMEKMDTFARAWHEMYREFIVQEVLGASCVSVHDSPGPSTFMTPPTPSTFMPPLPAPSMCMPPLVTVDPVATMELPPGLADDEDVVEVEVPMTLFVTPQATA
jgi:hypothetical protein